MKGKSLDPSSTSSSTHHDGIRASDTKDSNSSRFDQEAKSRGSSQGSASTTKRYRHRKYQKVDSSRVKTDQAQTQVQEEDQPHITPAASLEDPTDLSSLHQRRLRPVHHPSYQLQPFSQIPPTPLTDPSTGPPDTMSKLSPSLKHLINAPFAKPSYTVINPSTLRPTVSKLASEASDHGVSTPAWLTFSTATAMTMNAPSAMTLFWDVAQKSDRSLNPVLAAELQREVGLKCISFNGIPRTINCLGAFYNTLPSDIRSKLSTKPTREFQSENIEQRKTDGLGLWDSVYYGFERKLLNKLGQSHPDLPVHIIHAHYASLLSNPSRHTYVDGEEKPRETQVGRVLTSLVAIACLRAQTGVGPQVVSHVFGLRKAYERGDAEAKGEVEVPGGKWLSSEEGNKWLLEWIDELVKGIGTMQEGETQEQMSATTFAPGLGQAKL